MASHSDVFGGDDIIPAYNETTLRKMGKDRKKIERMTKRANRKKFLIYPESRFKMWWDLFMTLILLMTCIMTPLDIAFDEDTGE